MASATSKRFRERAAQCRSIAEEVREPSWIEALLDLAKDLEDDADRMDAEDGSA